MKKRRTLGALLIALVATAVACGPSRGKIAKMVEPLATAGEAKATEEHKNVSADEADSLALPALRGESGEIILRRKGYTVSYNAQTKLPNWVAWRLTADHTSGPFKRDGVPFHEDEDVPAPRADTRDYVRSGYDRGHMCPAGDNKWDALAMEQSFLMTNVCPQNHNLNRSGWNSLEQQCRSWAGDWGEVYIVCGPILYRQQHRRIGANKVVVPEAFFKVVLAMRPTPKAIGFIYRNQEGGREWGDYVNSVDQVERITGYDFFPLLPDSIEARVEAEVNIAEWPK